MDNNQYVTCTYIENEGDRKPTIEIDTRTIAPDVCLTIGVITMHLTPQRLIELGDVIRSWQDARESAARDTTLPPEISAEPETPFD